MFAIGRFSPFAVCMLVLAGLLSLFAYLESAHFTDYADPLTDGRELRILELLRWRVFVVAGARRRTESCLPTRDSCVLPPIWSCARRRAAHLNWILARNLLWINHVLLPVCFVLSVTRVLCRVLSCYPSTCVFVLVCFLLSV